MDGDSANRLLGYPDDARLLIVNADDFGMYRGINEAVLRTLKEGIVRSTSLMAPCPGASQAIRMLEENPDIHFGVHLSVIRDIDDYRWGPVLSPENVPSLLDESGCFYSVERIAEMLARASLAELEMEFRAQIEIPLAAGLEPTHLDWHSLHGGGRADVFDLTLELAREYGLALRVSQRHFTERVQSQSLPNAHDMLDSFRLDVASKASQYVQMLRELPVGLSEWAVHPGLGDAESQATDPGWQVRRTDFDFLISSEARETVEREGIILISYKPLQEAWRSRAS